jgi:hypothetical protein
LSVPCRPDTSHIRLSLRQGARCTVICPTTPDSASMLGRDSMLLRVQQHRTSPPCLGGLRCYHVPHGSGSRLPTQEGSDAVTCSTAPDPASLLRRASVLPRVLRHWTLPPYSGGLRCCCVPHGSEPRLPAREGFDTVTCPTAPDTASLLRRAPTLSHISRLSMSRIHQE